MIYVRGTHLYNRQSKWRHNRRRSYRVPSIIFWKSYINSLCTYCKSKTIKARLCGNIIKFFTREVSKSITKEERDPNKATRPWNFYYRRPTVNWRRCKPNHGDWKVPQKESSTTCLLLEKELIPPDSGEEYTKTTARRTPVWNRRLEEKESTNRSRSISRPDVSVSPM